MTGPSGRPTRRSMDTCSCSHLWRITCGPAWLFFKGTAVSDCDFPDRGPDAALLDGLEQADPMGIDAAIHAHPVRAGDNRTDDGRNFRDIQSSTAGRAADAAHFHDAVIASMVVADAR